MRGNEDCGVSARKVVRVDALYQAVFVTIVDKKAAISIANDIVTLGNLTRPYTRLEKGILTIPHLQATNRMMLYVSLAHGAPRLDAYTTVPKTTCIRIGNINFKSPYAERTQHTPQ